MFRIHLTGCAVCLASLLALHPAAALAAAESLCPAIKYEKRTPTIPPQPPGPNPPIRVRADRVERATEGETIFSGNVELQYGDQTIFADRISYDKDRDEFEASGNVTLLNASGNAVETSSLKLQPQAGTGATDSAILTLGAIHARGSADRIVFESRTHSRLEGAHYTTCPVGHDDWIVTGSKIDLNYAKDTGVARGATVRFKGVPLIYLPYFSFPISDQRKSGFLVPRLGTSSTTGFYASTPYYFNILPNLDATLTPRFMAQRGILLGGETRYLMPNYNGALNIEYIPNDRVFGGERHAATFTHNQIFNPYWSGYLNLNNVSDDTYFTDYSQSIAMSSQTQVPQLAQLNYGGSIWNLNSRFFAYQTIDPTIPIEDRPYRRLPQLLFSADPPFRADRPRYLLDGEFVNFQRAGSVSGERFDVSPAISLPFRTAYSFITPKASVRYTAYNLTGTAGDSQQTRTLPIFSLDSGLQFDRQGTISGRAYTQTLEPRLFYLYVPNRNQDALPNFDSTLPDLSYYNLFRENRFVGADRIGDANQATVGVSSRFLDDTGRERVRASLGETFYFQDRQVNLPPGTVVGQSSDVVGELQAWLASHWYTRGALQWDPDAHRTDRNAIYLQYRPASDKIINIGYRYNRDLQEQVDLSAQWPVTRRWTLLGRGNYSLRDATNLDSYVGFVYRACCWATGIYAERRLIAVGDQIKSIMFEFELSGLGRLGQPPLSPLRENAFMLDQ